MADCKINIMMFGGRRCGKTSVITAMYNEPRISDKEMVASKLTKG